MLSLRELGELKIIDILEQKLGASARMAVGYGDDISAITLGGNRVAVLKTDMLVGSTDVPPGMTMRQAARKAVVANVSDLAAKGVRPLAGIVALGLPSRLNKTDIEEIGTGLRSASREYGFDLIGGDTNESRDLTISVALFAIADRRRLVLRSGACDGDLVAVTGGFGATAAGLKELIEHGKRADQLSPSLYRAVFVPRAQLDVGLRLAASRTLTSSIDSSDGLAWSLHELTKASRIGIRINEVPTSREVEQFATRYSDRAEDLALYGGEEYHLVVTVKPERIRSAERAARGRLRTIGVVTRRFRGVRLKWGERDIRIPMKGWEHFKSK